MSPALVTSLLDEYVVWCGCGDNFTFVISTSTVTSAKHDGHRHRVWACGANESGQLGPTLGSDRKSGDTGVRLDQLGYGGGKDSRVEATYSSQR